MARTTPHWILPVLLVAALGAAGACSDSDTPTRPGAGDTSAVDVTPPSRVADLSVLYVAEENGVVLTWTAPGDDDRVAGYDIRYGYSFPLHWELARRVEDPPEPAQPGQAQSCIIASPLRGSDIFVAVRSVDASGNESATSTVATTRIDGYALDITCIHALTAEPIAGLDVTVTSRHVYELTSDDAGGVSLDDLASGTVAVGIRPGNSGVPFHYINDAFVLDGDRSVTYKMIPYEPAEMGVFDSVFEVFLAAVGYSYNRPIFKKWRSVPVPIYMPDYVNSRGIDYGRTGREALMRWEERTGLDLWAFVDEPPDSGVSFAYRPRSFMGQQVGYTEHENDVEGYPLTDQVYVVDDFSDPVPLFKTMLHELGHTIRFTHLPAGYLMYGGQPLPDDVTDDEVLAARFYTAIPNGINLRVYDVSVPAEAR